MMNFVLNFQEFDQMNIFINIKKKKSQKRL